MFNQEEGFFRGRDDRPRKIFDMKITEVFDTAIDIEKRLSNLYYKFSNLFRDNSEVYNFWIKIASHEKLHCETLLLNKGCQAWDSPSVLHKVKKQIVKADIAVIESLNLMLKDFERRLKKETVSLQDAIGMLLKIENSDYNHIYNKLIHTSGIKFQQAPDDPHRSVYEHMKIIKAFSDKYYTGNSRCIRVEDYKNVKVPARPLPGDKRGKITEIVRDMSYGFIEGEDGEAYMFLPEDITEGTWDDAEVDKPVEFSAVKLPWGPRAKYIKYF